MISEEASYNLQGHRYDAPLCFISLLICAYKSDHVTQI